MARWHKRPPSSPLTLPPFPRVCCHCLCVFTCLVTHTHIHIESSQNGTTLAANNASSTRSCLQGASRVCVYVPAWVSVCVVRECGLCHVRHFVTYFLSFVSCVFASFSASLVSGDSSSSSLHVTHTHRQTHVAVCMCVGFVAKCVAVSLCVCVFQKMLHCFWHARRHRDSLSLTPTLRHALKSTLTHTHTLLRINQLKKSIWRCHPWVADWRCAVATFVVILWQHL